MTAIASPLDRANPVSRLAAAIILSIPLLVTLDWVSAAVACGLDLAAYVLLNRSDLARPLTILAKRLLPLLIAGILAGVTMVLYGKPGGTTYWQWGFILISQQSIAYGVAIVLRVLALGLATVTTLAGVDPTDLADGLAQVVHLPARFVLGALAGIRLIGALGRDWRSMELARRARGLGDTGAVRRFATLAFALLVTAIRRGSSLATAMEARGFGAGRRTWARRSTVGWPDAVCLIVAATMIGLALLSAVGMGSFHWIGAV